MTEDEARTVIGILAGADNGCPVCVGAQFEEFERMFPQFAPLVEAAWDRENPSDPWSERRRD